MKRDQISVKDLILNEVSGACRHFDSWYLILNLIDKA